MPKFSYKFLGLEKLIDDLQNDEEMFEEFVEQTVEDVSQYVENKAKKYCPVDTGKLRASIQRNRIDRFEQEVIADTEYARFVEYGTSKTREQAYMRPAGDEAQGLMPKFIIKGLKRYL